MTDRKTSSKVAIALAAIVGFIGPCARESPKVYRNFCDRVARMQLLSKVQQNKFDMITKELEESVSKNRFDDAIHQIKTLSQLINDIVPTTAPEQADTLIKFGKVLADLETEVITKKGYFGMYGNDWKDFWEADEAAKSIEELSGAFKELEGKMDDFLRALDNTLEDTGKMRHKLEQHNRHAPKEHPGWPSEFRKQTGMNERVHDWCDTRERMFAGIVRKMPETRHRIENIIGELERIRELAS
ncbi:hypothetical protein HY489_02265 [Candidatus Woesearchaeota archaeon]|nr:hypothetical protein [Candidatus Woesearchaeota archaeon]